MESNLKKIWKVREIITPEVDENLKAYTPLIRQILFNRGITDSQEAQAFLSGSGTNNLDPFLLKGMSDAVDRLEKAIELKEPIIIYGDYDVDGVTATVLLVEVLSKLGASVSEYIPNRYDEGYGLNKDALEAFGNKGVKLVVTVDCGARSIDEADFALFKGVDLIISDHHQPGPTLPRAVALINPKQPEDKYPEKELTGVGLAYKIAQALFIRRNPGISAEDWLDLVALGTIADMAPLVGENRQLVTGGLARIHEQKRQGLFSLESIAGLNPAKVNAGDIGYVLGPRLNAAGRIESAMAAFNLLRAEDVEQAGKLAQQLDDSNKERQVLTREMQTKAAERAQSENPDAFLIFASDVCFKEGILGLAAARLVETYYRPAIVAHLGEEETRASCRSIPQFHITEALDQCADLLVRYGGHKAAAGFTVSNANLKPLIDRLRDIAEKQLSSQDLQPLIEIELEMDLYQLKGDDFNLWFQDLARLQPTGIGNPEPIFCSSNLEVKRIFTVGKDKNHLRLSVITGENEKAAIYDGIAFRQGYWIDKIKIGDQVNLAYTLEKNEYRGQESIQFNIKDIRPAV